MHKWKCLREFVTFIDKDERFLFQINAVLLNFLFINKTRKKFFSVVFNIKNNKTNVF